MIKTDMEIDMLEYYRKVASLSNSYTEYWENASNGLALICMGTGIVPQGNNYENFIKAWEERSDKT